MGGVRDGFSNFRFFEALGPGDYPGSANVTGSTVDRRGLNAGENYETLVFVVHAGEDQSGNSAGVSVMSAGWIRMQHGTSNVAGAVVWSNVSAQFILTDIRRGDDDTVLGSGDGSNTNGWLSISHALLRVSGTGSGLDNGTFFIMGGVSADHQSYWESKCVAAGYVGDHRWVRLVASVSNAGDTSGIAFAAIAVLGLPGDWPVNTNRHTD